MANEEDECDSSSLCAVASQSDVTSFLQAQAAKIIGVNSNISDDDDDESSMDDSLLARFTQFPSKTTNSHSNKTKSYLSRSCFASISSQKQNISDDLTELKWLSTFKLKEFQDNKTKTTELKETPSEDLNNKEDQISKLSNELKSYDNQNINPDSISYGVLIFLALYSKRDDKQTPWLLTIKQIYEYIQKNIKQITNKRGWKNLLKQTLIQIPCFIKTKQDIPKSRSLWTIDQYYRPLLTKAYLTSLISTNEKQISLDTNRSSESIINNFAPKATVKTKALSRLYERLCEEKSGNEDGDEADSNKRQRSPSIKNRKRPRSTSASNHQPSKKNNDEKRLSSSSPWTTKLNKRSHRHLVIEPKTSTPNKGSSLITPSPSLDHMYSNPTKKRIQSTESTEYNKNEDDECDSNSSIHSIRKSIITTRSQTAARNIKNTFVHRRKSSPPKKRLSLGLSSHRPNTRINKKIIEQDLELLRQANVDQQPLDLSNRTSSSEESIEKTTTKTPNEDILDLSLSQ